MDTEDKIAQFLTEKMANADSEERINLLHLADNLHVMLFVAWATMEAFDHKDHKGDTCAFNSMKKVAEGYVEQFGMSITKSVQATCEANGLPYALDPNKKVREEILNETH